VSPVAFVFASGGEVESYLVGKEGIRFIIIPAPSRIPYIHHRKERRIWIKTSSFLFEDPDG
jgi:hypothetical protein